MPDESLKTVHEVAAMFKLSPETIRDWIRDGKIQGAVKVGKAWRIPAASIRAMTGMSS